VVARKKKNNKERKKRGWVKGKVGGGSERERERSLSNTA
jgi:hypothetical protein